MATDKQIERAAELFADAFKFADKHEIFVVITPEGITIEGRHAVDLPTTYAIVKTSD